MLAILLVRRVATKAYEIILLNGIKMENQEINQLDSKEFILKKHQESIDNIFFKINSIGIPVIKCREIIQKGFVICIDSIDDLDKSLIIDGSICAYTIEIYNNEYDDAPEFCNGMETCFHTYIRLGASETWVYVKNTTFVGALIFLIENKYVEDDDCEEDEDYEEVDYSRLNRLSTIVAKSKGFNLLKNRNQRKSFSQAILSKLDEEIGEHEYYGIAVNAETFYDFGVLPIEARRLKDEGKTESEIAKELGHTKARIEKALLCDVPDVIRNSITEYDGNQMP